MNNFEALNKEYEEKYFGISCLICGVYLYMRRRRRRLSVEYAQTIHVCI